MQENKLDKNYLIQPLVDLLVEIMLNFLRSIRLPPLDIESERISFKKINIKHP